MHTHFAGTTTLDEARLAKDLEQSASFVWSEAYSDYIFGGAWKSCMLFARGGDNGDGVVTNYDHGQPSTFTAYGLQLPYLHELISAVADLDRLNFARLAKVSNSVGVPHRDLLELSDLPDATRNAHRMHIPLATNDQSFFTERDTVFRMRLGEVWFLDASQIHAVAVMSPQDRIHLMLDFVDRPSDTPLVRIDDERPHPGIPPESIVPREPLTREHYARLLALADLLTTDTFDEVFSIVIKYHYRFDGGDDFVWRTMIALANACRDRAVPGRAEELRRYFTLERSA